MCKGVSQVFVVLLLTTTTIIMAINKKLECVESTLREVLKDFISICFYIHEHLQCTICKRYIP